MQKRGYTQWKYEKGDIIYFNRGDYAQCVKVDEWNITLRPGKITYNLGSGVGALHEMKIRDLPTIEYVRRPYKKESGSNPNLVYMKTKVNISPEESLVKDIAAYIAEMEIRISALQENIVFANKLMKTYSSILKDQETEGKEVGKTELKIEDFQWQYKDEEESPGMSPIRCLGLGQFSNEVLFKSNWFQEGDRVISARLSIHLVSGPTATTRPEVGGSHIVYSYKYIVIEPDPSFFPKVDEYFTKY